MEGGRGETNEKDGGLGEGKRGGGELIVATGWVLSMTVKPTVIAHVWISGRRVGGATYESIHKSPAIIHSSRIVGGVGAGFHAPIAT